MVVAAEGARACAALPAGFSIASSRLPVSVEGSGGCAGTVVNSAAYASAAGEIAPVVKRSAPGEVPAAAKHCVSVMPVESPMTPSPSKAAEPADSEAEPELEIRAAKPDSGIRIPPRPSHDGITVNQPRIICRDINHIGLGRLNVNIRAVLLNDFVLRVLKSAGLFRFVAHHLHRVHHILLLVVVSVAES